MSRREHEGEKPGETQRTALRLRRKRRSGEKLTRRQAGKIGAAESIRKTRQRVRRAKRAGHGRDVKERYKVHSWTNDPAHARRPHMTEAGSRKASEARSKKASGKTLTRSEAGALGGAARVRRSNRKK